MAVPKFILCILPSTFIHLFIIQSVKLNQSSVLQKYSPFEFFTQFPSLLNQPILSQAVRASISS